MPETFPLSLQNTNAKSALISTVEQVGYQIKVFEMLEDHQLNLYF
jgi:hypothetical protein